MKKTLNASWSSSLIKTSISEIDYLNDYTFNEQEKDVVSDLRFKLQGRIEGERIKQISKLIKNAKVKNPTSSYKLFIKTIKNEIKEIIEDHKFKTSSRGAFILYANDYGQSVYKELRKINAFKDVFIGSKAEDLLIVVHGKVSCIDDLMLLSKIINKYKCKSDIEFRVRITQKKLAQQGDAPEPASGGLLA